MMITELKAKNITACPGSVICVAEATVQDDEMNEVFVTYAEDDLGEHFTVSESSVYTYLVEDSEEIPQTAEEYEKQKDAKGSAYWPVFALLKKTLKGMDEVV